MKNLPTNPGVYQYKNSAGKIIYIGKAKNLKNRVSSYFHNHQHDAKTNALLRKIYDVELTVVGSEAEALILEDTLIKKNKPQYNIMLRDDKTYPYIRITNEDFPRIFKTRKVIRDGSKYFGPYTDGSYLNFLLRILRDILKYRTCAKEMNAGDVAAGKFKLCLNYQIKKCSGVCAGCISQADYNSNIKSAVQILQGKTGELVASLSNLMNDCAEKLEFEKAAIIKNQLDQLQTFTAKQRIVTIEEIDRDVVGIFRLEDSACTLIFMIRHGKLIGKKHFIINNVKDRSDAELIQATIEKWYLEADIIPKEILLSVMPEEPEFISDWLREKRGRTLELVMPKLGDKKKLVAMANANAEFTLREYFITVAKKNQTQNKAVLALQKDLGLPKAPVHIECFDNSHLQGTDYVSSMVFFKNGKPFKSGYRKYRLNDVPGNDDFAAMREVVRRRYQRLIDEKSPLPELIIVDGGKGQLSSAIEILESLNIMDKVNIIGLAKRLDEVFVPHESDSIMLPRNSASLKLIQQLRDEAHRFAITYHRSIREKRTIQTELTEIPGIGPAVSQKLLIKFGSVNQIKKASREELLSTVNAKIADAVISHFSNIKSLKQ